MSRTVLDSVRQIWRHVGLDEAFLRNLHLRGNPDTAILSSFRVGHLAQASISLGGLAASAVHAARNRKPEGSRVTVDARLALLNFVTEGYTIIDGDLPRDIWDDLAGLYATRDGHVRIHTNFPHHRDGILSLLQCSPTRSAVAEALLQEDAVEFETGATAAGMCVAAVRSFQEWDAHPQSGALRGKLPIELIKIGDAPPRPRNQSFTPLEGIKVLELSRVLAGPVAGRTLARFGADVLWITSPRLPSLPILDIDTSRGKRAAQLDLNEPAGAEKLHELAKGCDVFLQSYRPGSLEKRGFGPRELAQLKGDEGIVVANLRGYGWEGPWAEKRAFDSLVQSATGFNVAEGEAWARYKEEAPAGTPIRTLPLQALDHGAGELLAFGIIAALHKTYTEGGSWEVRVSLAGTGQWLRDLGQLTEDQIFRGESLPPRTTSMAQEIQQIVEEWSVRSPKEGHSGDSRMAKESLVALKSAVELSGIPANAKREVPSTLDCDDLEWR